MSASVSKWRRDPIVHAGAIAALLTTGAVLFSAKYLPYIDWAAHVGKIGVLAHGGDSGATAYFTRSLAPTPYLAFYAFAALLAQVVSVEVAAKLAITIAAALLTYGAAELAEATGRHPRSALVAPLALFGMSLGWGFSTWLFALPWSLFAFAAAERLIDAHRAHAPLVRPAAWLALFLALCWLGHALLFIVVAPLVAARIFVSALGARSPRLFGAALVSLVPSAVFALYTLLFVLEQTPRARPALDKMFSFRPLAEHVSELATDLLQRDGMANHRLTMIFVVVVFAGALLLSLRAPMPKKDSWGLEIYTLALLGLFFFGPMSIEWPVSAWLVYPRYGTLAFLLVWLLPRPSYSGRINALPCVSMFALLVHNTMLNIPPIERFDALAERFDPVRATIPKGARVLALTVAPPGDFSHAHQALGALYCYLLADGAAYTAFMMDDPLHPVRYRGDVRQPRAPFWRSPDSFDPRTHGADYDFLVLRGDALVARTLAAGLHEEVKDVNGWHVLRTKSPPPRLGEP